MFMAVATAAPITAMVGNVPIAIGSGNGANAPAGYLVATIVLSLFALGYSAMAKHITSTGAFYGYISHGLGRVVGMAAGALTTLAYVVFEAALVGIFAFFASTFVSAHMGPDVNWRSEEHTSELQSLMRISYAVFCLKNKKKTTL